jgi:hypothetical protein
MRILLNASFIYCRGNEKFFEAVKKVVISSYPDWTTEAIPMHLNEWMEMIVQENKKLK